MISLVRSSWAHIAFRSRDPRKKTRQHDKLYMSSSPPPPSPSPYHNPRLTSCTYHYLYIHLFPFCISMPRTIYLAIFSNGASPAHYAVFIPKGGEGNVGKLIHVTGNPATGFFLQFRRNYDFGTTMRNFQQIPLAQVKDQYITDTPGNGTLGDTTACDRLESVATMVQPPGRSPNPFDPSVRIVPLDLFVQQQNLINTT